MLSSVSPSHSRPQPTRDLRWVETRDGTVALTHLWWTHQGPAEDPFVGGAGQGLNPAMVSQAAPSTEGTSAASPAIAEEQAVIAHTYAHGYVRSPMITMNLRD